MGQGLTAGSGPAPAEAEDVGIMTRRLMLMSKGLTLALTGAFICAAAAFGWAASDFPGIRTYIVPLAAAGGLSLALLHLGVERARARADCQVRTLRQGTLRENLGVAAAILFGVVALLLLNECLPEGFDRDYIWIAFLGFIGAGFSGYFLFQARRLSLPEPALLGLGIMAFCAVGLYAHFVPLQEKGFQMLLIALEAGFGLLVLAVGISLHRRWNAWRAQAMKASGEEQP